MDDASAAMPQNDGDTKPKGVKKLLLLHFNDVYNVEGSAARFAQKVKSFRDSNSNPLLLFSGDCFNPSMMSTVTRGKHMVPVLNAMDIHTACLGNHDLDFGLDNFVELAKECTFEWLVGNVIDKQTGELLGGLRPSRLFEWNGVKIGLVALVEQEWLSTLSTLDESTLDYLDNVVEGSRIAKELKQQGAELVLALTHMRAPNDINLLSKVEDIDIVLGGHDHSYQVQYVEPHGNLLVKSGTDFRDLTSVWVEIDQSGRKRFEWERHTIDNTYPEDPEVAGIVEDHVSQMAASLDDVVGYTASPLEGRFSNIRTQETNLGNLLCDIFRASCGTDLAFINSGTFRSDRVHAAGNLTKRDIVEILPMLDESVVLELSGSDILEVLENSVSQYPKLEGRFLQISGIKYSFDPRLPAGKRVHKDSVFLLDSMEKLDHQKMYTATTKAYLATGKDGFDMLESCKVLVSPDIGPLLTTLMRNHFVLLEVLNNWHEKTVGKKELLVKRFVGKMKVSVDRCSVEELTTQSRTAVFHPVEQKFMVSPIVEGRIRCVSENEE